VAVSEDGDYGPGSEINNIDGLAWEKISRTIIFYASQTLRIIALGLSRLRDLAKDLTVSTTNLNTYSSLVNSKKA